MIYRVGNTIYCTSANAKLGTRTTILPGWRVRYNTDDFETACQKALQEQSQLEGAWDRDK